MVGGILQSRISSDELRIVQESLPGISGNRVSLAVPARNLIAAPQMGGNKEIRPAFLCEVVPSDNEMGRIVDGNLPRD